MLLVGYVASNRRLLEAFAFGCFDILCERERHIHFNDFPASVMWFVPTDPLDPVYMADSCLRYCHLRANGYI